MTPEELEAAIRAGDTEQCVALLREANELQRRAAAPVAQKWHSAAWHRHLGGEPPEWTDVLNNRQKIDRIVEAAATSLAGTATLTELKKLGWRAWHLSKPAWDLLAHRKPEWLQDWAEWVVAENTQSWTYVRQLVRDRIIDRPDDHTYITAMIGHRWPNSILEFLREDPDLLDHEIWRLFEVEGGGENSLASRDKYGRGDHTWTHALLTLSAEGRIPRDRLLDVSLDALQRDFSQFRAGWFSSFHEALSPTPEERTARVDQYLALLASPVPPTVSFALKSLAVVEKAGHLPGEPFVGHVPAALAAREKGTVTLALKLLEKTGKRDPSLAGPISYVACEALLHEKPDVQEAALNVIDRLGRPDDPVLRDLLRGRIEDLAPSQRPRAEKWLGVAASAPTPAPQAAPDVSIERSTGASELLQELAGVPAVQQRGLEAPPVDLRDFRIPRLDPEQALQPVKSLDELIELLSMLVENQGPPDDIERALDGIARLCAERPPDFERLTAPLKKRAAALLKRYNAVPFGGWLLHDLPATVSAWLTGTVLERPVVPARDLTYFYGNRLMEVARLAAAQSPTVLLGTPTHAGGWLDPRVLVERVHSRPSGGELLVADAVQALLRLAPDHRAEALARAADLSGELGQAIRHALGAEGVKVGKNAPLWAAAARARDPLADDPAVAEAFKRLGPDAGIAAKAHLIAERRTYKDRGKVHVYFPLEVKIEPSVPARVDPLFPTVLLRHHSFETDLNTRRWLATLWPFGRESWFTLGAALIAMNLDWWEAMWDHRVHLEGLLEPDAHLGPMGRTLLGLGLAAKEPGESGLATDAAITALADGRLTGESLGQTLAELLTLGVDPAAEKPGGAITATRWAKTLAVVARTSTLHALSIHAALQRTLASQPSLRPADLAAVLELLHELSAQFGAAITDPDARRYLESQKGSGKGGKLAQSLLALVKNGSADQLHQAEREALEGRLQRAERWQRMVN